MTEAAAPPARAIALLDVNVLIALFDAAHLHHDAAHDWFRLNRSRGWATCPITETGMVRILSSAAYPGRQTTLRDAGDRLRAFCASPHHNFWPEGLTVRARDRFRLQHVQGHAQLTDVYLLALAVTNGGRLATLDAGIPVRSVAGAAREHLAIISS